MPKHICPRCGNAFEPKRKNSKYCSRICSVAEAKKKYRKELLEKYPHYYRDATRKWRIKMLLDPTHHERIRQSQRKRYRSLRLSAMIAYGGLFCSCNHNGKICGPHPFEFLAIDHINGKNKDVEETGGLYVKLKRLGYPSGYRILCHNCNSALGFYGFCPMSKTEKQERQNGPPFIL